MGACYSYSYIAIAHPTRAVSPATVWRKFGCIVAFLRRLRCLRVTQAPQPDPEDLPARRLSGRTMARTGLRMMPTFPSSPLKFRTAGFPRYGFKAGLSDGAFPDHRRLSLLPSYRRAPVCIHPSCSLAVDAAQSEAAARWSAALPQGPSLRSGLCCPGPSSLNRPHPPHSQAHRNFTVCGLYAMPSLCGSA